MSTMAVHYQAPGAFTRRVFNPFVAWLTRRGLSVWGSRVLSVPGRRTGRWHDTPVNLVEIGGETYLVAPRGETQWVRNLRVSGHGRLRLGRRVRSFTAVEVGEADRPAILRPYLRRWRWEVGQFFGGVGPDATDEQLLAVSPRHPVFRLEIRAGHNRPRGRR